MKHLRKITALMLVLTLAVVCLGLASCSSGCNHEYGDWVVRSEVSCTHDGVKWRTCTLCQYVDTLTETATGHTEGDVCTVCGSLTFSVEQLAPSFENTDSILLRLKDVSIVTEATSSEENMMAMMGNVSVELAELYLTADGDKLSGWGSGAIVFDALGNTAVSADVYIDGDVLYYEASGLEPFAEMMGDMLIGDSVYGALNVKAIQTLDSSSSPDDMEDILGSVISSVQLDPEAISDEILTWLEDELAPLFSEAALDVNIAKIEAAINKGIANLLKIETTSAGKTVSLNLAELKKWNQELATKTIAELIDELMGEGYFEGLKAGVDDMLDYTVEDFLAYLTVVQGIKVSEIPAALDKLAVAITEDESATFEELIGYEGDLAQLLTDEELLSYSVGDALKESMGALSLDEVKTTINALLTSLEQMTVYNLMGVMGTEMVDYVDQMIDLLDSMVSYVITLDAEGKFVSAVTSLVIPAELTGGAAAVSVTDTLTSEGAVMEIVAEMNGMTVTMTAEMIIGYDGDTDMSTYAAIKSKVDALPLVTEEILADLGYDVEKDASGNIVSAEMLDEWGDYAFIDIASGYVYCAVTEGCSDVICVTYAFGGVYELREYTSETEYEVYYSVSKPIPVDLYYDTVNEEFVSRDEFEHDYVELSDNFDSVSCGDTYTTIYGCDRCDSEITEESEKEHLYDYVYAEADEGVYTESEVCEYCSESTVTVSLTADPDKLVYIEDSGLLGFAFSFETASSSFFNFVVDAGGNDDVYISLYIYTDDTLDDFFGSFYEEGYLETGDVFFGIGTNYVGVCIENYLDTPVSVTLTLTSASEL